MNTNITHVIFDFDGTLVDSAPAILDCFRKVLAAHDILPRLEIDNRLIGPPLVETMMRLTGLDDSEAINLLVNDFKQCYDCDGIFATRAYDGIEGVLHTLCSLGFHLHIATNKRTRPTHLILDHLGLTQHFDSVYTIDRVIQSYPNKTAMLGEQLSDLMLPTAYCGYIGDKIEDGLAADANELRFFAAAWGYGEWHEVPECWSVVATPLQLPELLCADVFQR